MKLRIMTMGGCNLPGGVALVLCDDEGRMLPNQLGATLEQEERAQSRFTVTFGINGKDVILDGGPAVDEEE